MTAPEIALPRRPEAPKPYSFPLVATIAPVVGALVVWAITRSPFALVFAVLGPVIAIGSLLDSRLQRRRTATRERARFLRDVEATSERIAEAKLAMLGALRSRRRLGSELALATGADPERWRYRSGPLLLTLGHGALASGLRLTGDAAAQHPSSGDECADEAFARLREEASSLHGAPGAVDAGFGIAVCGARPAASAYARSLVIQLASALSPAEWALRSPDSAEEWLAALPHPRAGGAEGERVEFVSRGPAFEQAEERRFVVALGGDSAEPPWDCRICIRVDGARAILVRHPDVAEKRRGAEGGAADAHKGPSGPMRADFVPRRLAESFAVRLGEIARAEGLAGAAEPPDTAALAALWDASAPTAGGLPAAFALDEEGPVLVDLVRDGPHAVVGGTTGSGKSELLISWVLSLARKHSPQEFSCLLVDFKGGSSFAALASIPHCVGLMTDLDPVAARRALESLRAELRHRERRIAEVGARSIDDIPSGGEPLPRLVVIVDEFAAMIGDFAELHALFADIAARGRSLGVHLILCTQRPGGVLRDSVMANCTLRISLRVNNGADSAAVIGTADAAALPVRPLGRALIALSGAEPSLAQIAVASPADVAAVVDSWQDSPPPRRPWLPALPELVTLAQLPHSPHGLAFGLLDVPDEQRQPPAVWNPARQGSLLVVGGAGSGKSSALAAIAAASEGRAQLLPAELEAAWDMLEQCAEGGTRPELLLIDDADALIARFDEKYRHLVVERLGALLRDQGAGGIRLVVSARRVSAVLQGIAALCDSQLLLRLPARQEHVLAGGDGAQYEPELRPGAAYWRRNRAQIAWVPPEERQAAPAPTTRRPLEETVTEIAARYLVVTPRPAAYAAGTGGRLTANAGGAPDAVEARQTVADPAGWQTRWAEFAALRRTHPVIFDRCSAAELRAVAGVTVLPPYLGREPGGAWLLGCDGQLERVQLPEGL